jgi:hypothetical protein
MGNNRSSVKQWLALLLCGAALALGSGARATTSNLLAVDYTYSLAVDALGSGAILTVDYVANQTEPPRITGELYLELWAFPVPYQGIAVAGYQQNGYKLASYSLGRLAPGYYLRTVNSGVVPYAPPPPGTWYVTSMIVEYDASAINSGGWLPRAFFNYPDPLTVAGGDIIPVAGLWWDPLQPGTGYSINVRHGVIVVIVYGYRPDGAGQWYIATGPLTGVGTRSMIAPLETYFGGPCIPCSDTRVPVPGPAAGAIELSFTSPTSGTVRLPGGRIAHIVPADF